VIKTVSEVLLLASFIQLSDCMNAVSGGILEGMGRQSEGAWINTAGYWFIGLPLGILFAFKLHMDLFGLWTGVIIGQAFVSVVAVSLVLMSDWKQQAVNARERITSGEVNSGDA
jgi:multidrug resistance protein, MATE family